MTEANENGVFMSYSKEVILVDKSVYGEIRIAETAKGFRVEVGYSLRHEGHFSPITKSSPVFREKEAARNAGLAMLKRLMDLIAMRYNERDETIICDAKRLHLHVMAEYITYEQLELSL